MGADVPHFDADAVAKQSEVFLKAEADRRNAAAQRDAEAAFLRDVPARTMPDPTTLSAIGLDLESLSDAAAQYGEALRQSATKFSETPLPRELARLTFQNRLLRRPPENFAPHEDLPAPPWPLETRTTLTPPADSALGDYSIAAIGEMGVFSEDSGEGGSLGWPSAWAAPVPAEGSLVFSYMPYYNGALYVLPDVRVQGTVVISSHGHWYTETWADLSLTLGCSVSQRITEWGPDVTVVHEHRDHVSHAAYWLTRQYMLYASTKVVAWEPVHINLYADLTTTGVSDYALARGDFATGAEHFIRVASILVILYPL